MPHDNKDFTVLQLAKQEKTGMTDNSSESKDLNKGTEYQAAVDLVVLDSDASESHVDGGAAKTSIGSSCSSCASRPIPPFLLKIYDMLGNEETNSIVSWNSTGTSFLISNPHSFAANVLPIYFRHQNFQSFITQLNSYGFKKISWEQWEYKNEYFRKGERHLLRSIKRRNQIPQRMEGVDSSSCSSSNIMEKDLEILIKEHNLLKAEVVKLKEKQETLEEKIASLKNQATNNEMDQKRMMLAAHAILSKHRDLSINTEIPMLEDNSETNQKNLKGKRKLDEKSDKRTMCSDVCSCSNISMATIVELVSEHLTQQRKIAVDEEEMGKHQSNTFISLEELIGESSDWVEYIKEMQEKAGHLKS